MSERLKAALFDSYRIERELGAGGMATVYLAEDLKHHRKVALKVLKPELGAVLGVERFLAEIRVTASSVSSVLAAWRRSISAALNCLSRKLRKLRKLRGSTRSTAGSQLTPFLKRFSCVLPRSFPSFLSFRVRQL